MSTNQKGLKFYDKLDLSQRENEAELITIYQKWASLYDKDNDDLLGTVSQPIAVQIFQEYVKDKKLKIVDVGVPQFSAISDVVDALKDTNITVIADGGIRFSGDAAKAFAAGAHSVMIGSMLAGTEESPGEVELFQGRSYKAYRGMGSLGAMGQAHGSSDRYFQAELAAEKLVPEGIEGRVPFKGSIRPIIHQIIGGIRSSMGYTGCKDLKAMRTKAEFVQVTAAGMTESHVHDVAITKEAPNYHQ